MQPSNQPNDRWTDSDAYDAYVGRWSRRVAERFLRWLAIGPGQRWLDIGSGSGALAQTILDLAQPRAITGVDRSADYVAFLRHRIDDSRASFELATAESLPLDTGTYDVVVSGLVLNFIADPAAAVREMQRVVRGSGTIAAYVWDYAGTMDLMGQFWAAAVALDPSIHDRDEALRFPLCQPEPLRALFHECGLHDVALTAIDIDTTFRNFDDYWTPFLGGQGPAPGYAMSLSEAHRAALRERLRAQLPAAADGSIALKARAWAVRGRRG